MTHYLYNTETDFIKAVADEIGVSYPYSRMKKADKKRLHAAMEERRPYATILNH